MSVFTWGLGKSGQLGTGNRENQTIPTEVRLVKKGRPASSSSSVKSNPSPSSRGRCVSTGGLYTAIIGEDGCLFTFGCGKHGRLGTGNEQDATSPVLVDNLCGRKASKINETVSCGLWHGCAVDSTGQLYSWGYKSHGVLGRQTSDSVTIPALVSSLASVQIAGVSCGNNFTLAWSREGVAYSWGCGRHGVLGQGSEDDHHLPTVIDYFQKKTLTVSRLAAGFAHSGAITADGQVYMFGKGKDGSLGLDTTKSTYVPTKCKTLHSINVTGLSCSVGEHHGHTLAVTDQGKVYVWGDGYKGKLGLGDQDSRLVPTLIPQEHFNNEDIVQVSAGGIHSAALSRQGHVFTWGCGSDGRLGHPEAQGHRYLFRSDVPRIVEALAMKGKALCVSASYYHTTALIEPQ